MHIAIQVNVPPYTYEDLDTAIHLAESALKEGIRFLYFCSQILYFR